MDLRVLKLNSAIIFYAQITLPSNLRGVKPRDRKKCERFILNSFWNTLICVKQCFASILYIILALRRTPFTSYLVIYRDNFFYLFKYSYLSYIANDPPGVVIRFPESNPEARELILTHKRLFQLRRPSLADRTSKGYFVPSANDD